MSEKKCAIEKLLENAKDMPFPPLRCVYFAEKMSIEIALIEESPIVFEKGEFAYVLESYGYPAGAIIEKNGIAFYLNELEGRGAKFIVLVEED